MSPADADDKPLSPDQERLVARLKRLSLVSALIMVGGFAAVFGVIGYRLLAAPKSAAAMADVTATLPRGAKIVASKVSGALLVVTIEHAGALEVRTFALDTLKPVGRLRFASEP